MPLRNERPETIVDQVAKVMLAEWARVEGKGVNISYVATFADMARAVVREFGLDDPAGRVVD